MPGSPRKRRGESAQNAAKPGATKLVFFSANAWIGGKYLDWLPSWGAAVLRPYKRKGCPLEGRTEPWLKSL